MAIEPMADAVAGETASAAEYNKVVNNIESHESWIQGHIVNTHGTINTRLDAVESKNADQDGWLDYHLGGVSQEDARHSTINTRLSTLEASGGGGGGTRRYARYEGSGSYPSGGYTTITFGTAHTTTPGVTTSDNRTFTLGLSGLWLVSSGYVTQGGASPSGMYRLYLGASTGAAYAYGNNTSGAAFAVGPLTKPVTSDGTATVDARCYLPGAATLSGGTYIEMAYLGPLG